MKQSSVIFGALGFGFIIYITLRGHLGDYINLFSGSSSESEKTEESDQKPANEIKIDKTGNFFYDTSNLALAHIANSMGASLPNLGALPPLKAGE